MGVFDFVKEAGAKVGIGDSKEEKEEAVRMEEMAAEAKEAAVKATEAKKQAASDQQAADVKARQRRRKSKEDRAEKLAENKKAEGLENYLAAMGAEIENLDVRFDDGKATISGTAATQEAREKAILMLGNTNGVAEVHDEIKVPEDADGESEMHIVVSGDTLSKIAKEVYGDAMKYTVIFEANRPMLSDPDKIYVGQVLRIPAQ